MGLTDRNNPKSFEEMANDEAREVKSEPAVTKESTDDVTEDTKEDDKTDETTK